MPQLSKKEDFLPNRLNFDAVVFAGCTMQELQILAISNLVINIILFGFITEFLFGMFLIGMGIAFPTTVGTVWCLAKILQRLKQGKPKGYVKQSILLWSENKGILQTPFIRRSGKWTVGRYVR